MQTSQYPEPAGEMYGPSYVPSVRTVHSTPKGGGLFWLLGFVASAAIIYYFFIFAARPYTMTEVLLIALGAVLLGGAISRKGTRGALLGFLVFFVPLMSLGVILLIGVAGIAGQAEGLEVIVPLIGTAAGILLIGFGVAAGFVGLIVGGIGGWISGKILPIGGRS